MFDYLKNHFELFTREEYRELDISAESKKILCDIGLPENPLPFLRFDVKAADNLIMNDYVVIGSDFGTNICLNSSDEVISVDPELEYPTRFINTNLTCLLECIIIYLKHEKEIAEADDNNVDRLIADIKSEFTQADPQSLQNDENWWSIILEQVETGLI